MIGEGKGTSMKRDSSLNPTSSAPVEASPAAVKFVLQEGQDRLMELWSRRRSNKGERKERLHDLKALLNDNLRPVEWEECRGLDR